MSWRVRLLLTKAQQITKQMTTTRPTTTQSQTIRNGERTSTTQLGRRLIGKRLLNKVFANTRQVDESNRDALAIECGYVSRQENGPLQIDDVDFSRALALASGLW